MRHYKYLTLYIQFHSLAGCSLVADNPFSTNNLKLDGAGVIRGDVDVIGGGVSRGGGVTRGGITKRYPKSRKSNGEVRLVGD